MKGKRVMLIIISAMIALLVAATLVQFRTIDETDIESLENMREAELRIEITNWKTKQEEASKKLEETKTMIAEYNEKIVNNQEAYSLLEKELAQAKQALGTTEVQGSCIVITLEDNEYAKIDEYDLFLLVNALKLAGAEAISINDQRVVSMTDIKNISDGFIKMNGMPLMSPYVVKAIGNQTYLESELTLKTYGYMDKEIKANNKTARINREDSIIIPKYEGNIEIKNAEEVKE